MRNIFRKKPIIIFILAVLLFGLGYYLLTQNSKIEGYNNIKVLVEDIYESSVVLSDDTKVNMLKGITIPEYERSRDPVIKRMYDVINNRCNIGERCNTNKDIIDLLKKDDKAARDKIAILKAQ